MGCMSGCPVLASLGTLVCNIAVNIPLAFAAVEELEMNSLSIRRKQPYAEGATPGTSEAQPAARSLLALAVSCKLHEGDMGRGVLIPSDIRSVLSCLALSCLVLSCLVGKSAACSVRPVAGMSAVGLAWWSSLPPALAADPAEDLPRQELQSWRMTASFWTLLLWCDVRHTS